MFTDMELLELAAKASGNTIYSTAGLGARSVIHWNPLTDDGDAFRLAADLSLGIQYDCYPTSANATSRKAFRVRVWSFQWFKEDFDDSSKMEAIRRVIVEAAANIGRRM